MNAILAISGDTFNPVQWSGPATRLGFAIFVFVLLTGGFTAVIKLKPRPEREATWAGSMALAVLVFAGMMLAYGVIPHEWLTFADSILEWNEEHYLFRHTDNIPIDFNMKAVRDIVAVGIYVFMLVTNVAMFAMWQKRGTATARAEAAAKAASAVDGGTKPGGMSRFGRPITKKA